MWRLLLCALLLWSGKAPAQKAAVTWYKVMKGYIDKYPVTMYLFYKGGVLNGQYYYDRTGKPIALAGTLRGGNLNLKADKESFKGQMTDSAFFGSWTMGKTMLPVRLHEHTREFLPFLNIWVKGEQKRRIPSKDDPGGASYEAAIIWPTDGNPIAPFLKKEIFSILEVKDTAGAIPGKVLQKQRTAFLKTSYEDEKDSVINPYTETLNLEVLYQDSRFLSLEYSVYEYTGGAHGQFESIYYTYDLEHLRRMGLTEVLDTLHYGEAVSRLLEAQYRKDVGLNLGVKLSEAGDVPLFSDSIPLTTNFFLTEKGIGFLYNEYEIGPYVLGPVYFFLSYSDLMPYLQPSFKALLN